MSNYLVEERSHSSWQRPVEDKDLISPPSGPSKGDRYLVGAFEWDILDEDCSDISDWVDNDAVNGVSEVDPAGQFRMDANTTASNNKARRSRTITLPTQAVIEVRLYHDKIGNDFFNQQFQIDSGRTGYHFYVTFNLFATGQLKINNHFVCEAVKSGENAEWQTWRFEINSITPSSATCDVYLTDSTHTNEKVGSDIDCSSEITQTDTVLTQWGDDDGEEDNCLTHVDYIRIGTYGDWVYNENNIAQYNGSSWDFYTPVEGWICWVKDENKYYEYNGSTWNASKTATIGIVIDGGDAEISTGYKGFIRIPFNCIITKATLLGNDDGGSVVIDIWKCSFADFDGGSTHPVDGDSITASAPPTISSSSKSEDTTLTGWTKNISAGEILGFNVDSIDTFTKVILELEASKE